MSDQRQSVVPRGPSSGPTLGDASSPPGRPAILCEVHDRIRALDSSSALFASGSRGRREGFVMTEMQGPGTSALSAVSNAMVKLHKEQFGRGPTTARSHYAGPDMLVCMMQDA